MFKSTSYLPENRPSGTRKSKPLLLSSLPIFPSKPYKPSLFLTFPVVFEIEEGAWEGLGMGCMEWMQLQKKKQDQTNFFEIHLTLLHIFYVLFHSDTWMGLSGTKTICLFSSHQESPSCSPKIDLPGREKTKSLSLFIAAILQHSLLYSTFSFRIQ